MVWAGSQFFSDPALFELRVPRPARVADFPQDARVWTLKGLYHPPGGRSDGRKKGGVRIHDQVGAPRAVSVVCAEALSAASAVPSLHELDAISPREPRIPIFRCFTPAARLVFGAALRVSGLFEQSAHEGGTTAAGLQISEELFLFSFHCARGWLRPLWSTGKLMKATLPQKHAVRRPFAACAALTLLSFLAVPATAGPPLFRSTPRSAPSSRIQVGVGVYSGPVYRQDYRYRQQGNSYGSRSGYCAPSFYYPAPYYPPAAVYVAPPVYAAQPFYAAPPVYQGLPPSSSANYRLLAPSGSPLVAQVQEKLRGYGYYRGGVDGLAGAGTRSAIRAYQVDRGIQVTGRVDEELLSDLGL